MWYVVLKSKGNARSMHDFGALLNIWASDHKNHKLKNAYAENLKGIQNGISNPSKFTQFIEIIDDTGQTAVVSKVSITGKSIDLSEIVKHHKASSDALIALLAWASKRAVGKKVTLTAAYYILLSIYNGYGFKADSTSPAWKHATKTTMINATMTMDPKEQESYQNKYPEMVFWEMLPDLIG